MAWNLSLVPQAVFLVETHSAVVGIPAVGILAGGIPVGACHVVAGTVVSTAGWQLAADTAARENKMASHDAAGDDASCLVWDMPQGPKRTGCTLVGDLVTTRDLRYSATVVQKPLL